MLHVHYVVNTSHVHGHSGCYDVKIVSVLLQHHLPCSKFWIMASIYQRLAVWQRNIVVGFNEQQTLTVMYARLAAHPAAASQSVCFSQSVTAKSISSVSLILQFLCTVFVIHFPRTSHVSMTHRPWYQLPLCGLGLSVIGCDFFIRYTKSYMYLCLVTQSTCTVRTVHELARSKV